MEARLLFRAPPADVLAGAATVYGNAFGQAPYREGPDRVEAFRQRVQRYARERDGFRFATVTGARGGDTVRGGDCVSGGDGGVVAVGLAALARPGDWWRDQVAAALGPQEEQRWLGALCLEVVHVAVDPAVQGRGVGRLVHDVLVAGAPAPTGILACHPGVTPAQRLYLGRGWTRLPVRLPAGDGADGSGDGDGGGSLLMARRL